MLVLAGETSLAVVQPGLVVLCVFLTVPFVTATVSKRLRQYFFAATLSIAGAMSSAFALLLLYPLLVPVFDLLPSLVLTAAFGIPVISASEPSKGNRLTFVSWTPIVQQWSLCEREFAHVAWTVRCT